MADLVTSWSTLIIALVSGTALIVAVVQIAENRRLARVKATLNALAEASALEQTFRYFDKDPDQNENRRSCLEFFCSRVEGRTGEEAEVFLRHVNELVNFSEEIRTLDLFKIIDRSLFLRGQCYNILSSYFTLEPVLLRLAKSDLMVFIDYRQLAIDSQEHYKKLPLRNSILCKATFAPIPSYAEPASGLEAADGETGSSKNRRV